MDKFSPQLETWPSHAEQSITDRYQEYLIAYKGSDPPLTRDQWKAQVISELVKHISNYNYEENQK